jgi:hypothetical protein
MMQINRAEAERVMSERGWLALVPEAFRGEVLRRFTSATRWAESTG